MGTNFPGGISSHGIPVFGGNFVTQGNAYFVNVSVGADTNSGKSVDKPLKTIAAAYAKCTAGQNDIVYFLSTDLGTSASTTDYWTAKLTWDKDSTHLIGVCAPTMIGQRARIAQKTTTGIDGLLTVSANNCIFANLLINNSIEDATSDSALTVTGYRNYFYNVNIQGLLSTAQSQAGSLTCATLSAAEENTFERCVFGTDTVAQGANWCLSLEADSRANTFLDCIFLTCSSAGTTYHVQLAADGLLGTTLFKNCAFLNSPTAAGAVNTMTLAIGPSRATTATDGTVLIDNCSSCGVADIGVGGCVVCAPNCGSATGITSSDICTAVAPT